MITKLRLINFRCFEAHAVELQSKSVLVGKNNAGKSTCVEALRLVSLVTERIENLGFKNPPEWTNLPLECKGVAPSLDTVELHEKSLYHGYGEPPALVSAEFSNGTRLDVHLGGKKLEVHAVAYAENGKPCFTRKMLLQCRIPKVSILPQIGPLLEHETVLENAYVKKNVQTSRASLHFRNQLRIFDNRYSDFQRLVTQTWPGLSLDELVVPRVGHKDGPISLLVRDGEFTAEASWMGHGLQMWLQTMWFLVRSHHAETLILDEPDVYMHADLQRKLVKMLLADPRQFVIATHSPEILSEVPAESVVILDRRNPCSGSATSIRVVQRVIEQVGSVHNLSLARLASQRRILFVEGDDVAILKKFQNVAHPSTGYSIDAVPSTCIEGWSGWPSVLTLARFFRHDLNNDFRIFCILDRDYRFNSEVQKRLEQAKDAGVSLFVWSMKELENYAIVPSAIARCVRRLGRADVSDAEVENLVIEQIDLMKDETFDRYAESYRQENKALGVVGANSQTRPIFNTMWKEKGGKSMVGGKQLLANLNTALQQRYGVHVTIGGVIAEMLETEVHSDISTFLSAVTSEM